MVFSIHRVHCTLHSCSLVGSLIHICNYFSEDSLICLLRGVYSILRSKYESSYL